MKKSDFKNLKPGTAVRLTRGCKRFFGEHALDFCTSGKGVSHADINSYFVMRSIGLGAPYTALVLGSAGSLAHVSVKVRGVEDTMYLERKEIKLAKPPAPKISWLRLLSMLVLTGFLWVCVVSMLLSMLFR